MQTRATRVQRFVRKELGQTLDQAVFDAYLMMIFELSLIERFRLALAIVMKDVYQYREPATSGSKTISVYSGTVEPGAVITRPPALVTVVLARLSKLLPLALRVLSLCRRIFAK